MAQVPTVAAITRWRKEAALNGFEHTDDIIRYAGNHLSQWLPAPEATALATAWVRAETSPAIMTHIEELCYAHTCITRIDNAVHTLVHHLVTETAPGDYTIQSSDPWTPDHTYHINGADCDCPDTAAPTINGHKACKHQIAVWLMKRMQTLEQQQPITTLPAAGMLHPLHSDRL